MSGVQGRRRKPSPSVGTHHTLKEKKKTTEKTKSTQRKNDHDDGSEGTIAPLGSWGGILSMLITEVSTLG